MTTSKKVLGVALALVFALGCFSVAAFAAVPAENAYALTLAPTASNYKPGDVVTFDISIETIDSITGVSGGEFEVAYDSDVFEPVTSLASQVSFSTAGSGITCGAWDDSVLILANSSIKAMDTSDISEDEATNYGWDAGIYFMAVEKGSKYIDCRTATKVLSFQLKVKETAENGSYVVGFCNDGFEVSQNCYLIDANDGGTYGGEGAKYGLADDASFYCGTCTVKVGEDAAPVIKASKTGDVVNTLVGWGYYDVKKDTCDGLFVDDGLGGAAWNLAVEAKFSAADLAAEGITFDENGVCKEIYSLEATVTVGEGTPKTASTQLIYGAAEGGTGEYVYRAVIAGIDESYLESDAEVSVEFGGTLVSGGEISGETVTFTFADVVDAAQARSSGAFLNAKPAK